jgi:hypothetical protein
MKIIDSIDPMVWFSLFTRVAHVSSVLSFSISINGVVVFSIPNTGGNQNSSVIKLVDYDTIGSPNQVAYYIGDFDLEGITSYNIL